MRKDLNLRFIIVPGLVFAFLANTFGPIPICPIACSAEVGEFRLPAPGVMVPLSPEFSPAILKGIKVHAGNPFRFDFILDQGDSSSDLKTESTKLIKYFLASLTVPEKDLWVNLSPYEKNRIVPEVFGQTQMGRDLLAEDYMLKQITASLIYPENAVGRRFWKRIYEEASQKFGTTNIPVNTFNKVWIVPEKAVVYENAKAGTAYVVESRLKVMLEQDYLALEKNQRQPGDMALAVSPGTLPSEAGLNAKATQMKTLNALGSQIVREVIIPELNKEVNEGRNFAQLRQVYNSLILATWYKKKIKDSILAQIYANRNKVAGIVSKGPNFSTEYTTEAIYQRYLQAFKKGVYNYIKDDVNPVSRQAVPRKYFSGGLLMRVNLIEENDIHPDGVDLTGKFVVGCDFAMATPLNRLTGEQLVVWYQEYMRQMDAFGVFTHEEILLQITRRFQESIENGEISRQTYSRYFFNYRDFIVPRFDFDLKAAPNQIKLRPENAVADIVNRIAAKRREGRKLQIIDITGEGAVGKTTFTRALDVALYQRGLRAVVLTVDNYLKPLQEIQSQKLEGIDQIDLNRLMRDLAELREGKPFIPPEFDLKLGRSREGRLIDPGKIDVIILEGVWSFALDAVRSMFDLKIYIHRSVTSRFSQWIQRSINEFDEQMREAVWRVIRVQFVEAPLIRDSAKKADIIVTADEAMAASAKGNRFFDGSLQYYLAHSQLIDGIPLGSIKNFEGLMAYYEAHRQDFPISRSYFIDVISHRQDFNQNQKKAFKFLAGAARYYEAHQGIIDYSFKEVVGDKTSYDPDKLIELYFRLAPRLRYLDDPDFSISIVYFTNILYASGLLRDKQSTANKDSEAMNYALRKMPVMIELLQRAYVRLRPRAGMSLGWLKFEINKMFYSEGPQGLRSEFLGLRPSNGNRVIQRLSDTRLELYLSFMYRMYGDKILRALQIDTFEAVKRKRLFERSKIQLQGDIGYKKYFENEKYRIMIIEDVKEVADEYEEILRYLGFEAETFLDWKDALKHFQDKPEAYSFILSDFNFADPQNPDMDGVKLARQFSEIRPDIGIVINTYDYVLVQHMLEADHLPNIKGVTFKFIEHGSRHDMLAMLERNRKYFHEAVDRDSAMMVHSFLQLKQLGYDTRRNEMMHSYSNESGYDDVLNQIRLPGVENRKQALHIGVSGVQNLDIMAARHSQWGILVDINQRTGELFGLIENIFRENPAVSREEFIRTFKTRIRQRGPSRFTRNSGYFVSSRGDFGSLEKFIGSSQSWLADDGRFGHIKNMFLEDRIIFIQANISNKSVFQHIADWMRQNGVTLDTFYISNVFDWVLVTKPWDLDENILTVSNEATLILDSRYSSELRLAVRNRKEFEADNSVLSGKGGIDFNSAKMDLQTQNAGGGIQFHIDPAQLAQLQNAPGFIPVIISIQPLKSLPGFLGIKNS